MKRKTILTVGLLLMLLVLAACSGSAPATSTQSQETNQTTGSESPQGTGTAFDPGEVSTDMKLALGTLQLEDTDLAVTAQQAKDLLPLWKAVRSLSTSQTASSDEIQALYQQIQETMTQEQMQAIDAMKFDQETTSALMQKLGIDLSQGNGNPGELSDSERATRVAEARANGNSRNGGFGGGGGPGGGAPGGGAPGGDMGGGMPPDAQNGQMGTGTPQAPGAGGGPGMRMNTMFVEPLIQLLETRANS